MEQFATQVVVKRNDEIHLLEVEGYDKIILSPGPGLPKETPLMYDVVKKYGAVKPILGVCLGMQGIAEVFGAELHNQQFVKHGVQMKVQVLKSSKLFECMPRQFNVGLYHSWYVDPASLPEELVLTCVSEEGVPMAIEHRNLPIYAVQFHPESIMSEGGLQLIENFINL